MSTANPPVPVRPDWPFANPWTWMLAGLTGCGLALAWSQVAGPDNVLVTWVLLAVGLLSAGASLNLRLNSHEPAYLDRLSPGSRSLSLAGLGLLGFGLAAAAAVTLLASGAVTDVPWSGTVLLPVLLGVPVVWGTAGYVCFARARTRAPLAVPYETALLLLLTSLCCFLASWGFYFGAGDDRWLTMRLYFAVLTLVAFLAAPVAVLPRPLARTVISVLILLHFGGILTAIVYAPPTPWLAMHAWVRFYRPYLQFLYLNNAYQFYAPEPNASHYVWLRVEYRTRDGETVARWEKSPRVREDGSPDYPSALQYQRRIALSDQVCLTETGSIPVGVIGPHGRPEVHPLIKHRDIIANLYEPRLGDEPVDPTLLPRLPIPYHPGINPKTNQYQKPNLFSRGLLASMARHAAREPHPDHPDAVVEHVRVYRVTHEIPNADVMALRGNGPVNLKLLPVLYAPYYMGKFDPDGKLLDEPVFHPTTGKLLRGDPLLYWCIPFVAENGGDPVTGRIYGFPFLHAGDREWVYAPGATVPTLTE